MWLSNYTIFFPTNIFVTQALLNAEKGKKQRFSIIFLSILIILKTNYTVKTIFKNTIFFTFGHIYGYLPI